MSPSIFEYVIKIILIHLDDQNEQVQFAMFNLLKAAAELDHKKVEEEVIAYLKMIISLFIRLKNP